MPDTAADPVAGPAGAAATPRRTALHGRHVALGAKLADFGGWRDAHRVPRRRGAARARGGADPRVGLFDVSHLGKVAVRGPGAAAFVDACLTNALGRIGPGRAQYSLCCDDGTGGVVDDLIVYLRADDDVLLVPNAANAAEVARRLARPRPGRRRGHRRARALRGARRPGPARRRRAGRAGPSGRHLPYMGFARRDVAGGGPVTVCRTGYTGERGYELLPPTEARRPGSGTRCSSGSARRGGLPCGLGARDTLRTEMGYPLHGHELSLDITPVQARIGLGRGLVQAGVLGAARAARRARARGRAPAVGAARARARRPAARAARARGRRTRSGSPRPARSRRPCGRASALALLARSVGEGDEVVVDVRGRAAAVPGRQAPVRRLTPELGRRLRGRREHEQRLSPCSTRRRRRGRLR